MYEVVNMWNMRRDGCIKNDREELVRWEEDKADVPKENAVNRSVRQLGKGANVKLVICWHGYTLAQETV